MTATVSQASTKLSVLLSAALDAAFTYRAESPLPPGTMVEASFAGRMLVGAVWSGEADVTVPEAKLKTITRVLDFPPLSSELMRFIESVAAFTLAPRGAVLSLCGLAHAAKPVKKPLAVPEYHPNLPTLSAEQQDAAEQLIAAPKTVLLDGVTGSGKTEVYFHAIAEMLKRSSPLRGEVGRGPTDITDGVLERPHPNPPPKGEGTTERVATLDPPSQILVLLPEIALTHQWVERFGQTFGAPPTVWHSHLTPAQRRKTWHAIANGEARVIVGARSALFLPYPRLRLIIVDEEHDPSFKQEDGVLYHARDMAVMRGHAAGANVILSSATPSLETLLNVQSGKYAHVKLPQRYGVAALPTVQLIDMIANPPERGDFLSPIARQAIVQTLNRGEQVLLFLNRRGYAPLLLCRTCGHRFQCDHCSAWMVVHGRKNETLHCHHCGIRKPVPPACPSCAAPKEMFAACGPGVERVMEEVQAMFAVAGSVVPPPLRGGLGRGASTIADNLAAPPSNLPPQGGEASPKAPTIALLSSDESIDPDTWNQITRGEIDIIVGTQMVAKGHHFPRLTLVVVVDADMGLEGADLRAGERTYQLLHQLGGRAGREERAGHVLIQTYQAKHPIMQALTRHDRASVMQLEMQIRVAGNWPPYGQLAAILLDGVDETTVRTAAQKLAQSAPQDKRIQVLGPAPAPLSKLRGQYRYRLLVKADKTIHLQRTLAGWLGDKKFSGVRIKLDVNPYYFL